MAIGSAPEIGITFRSFGELTPDQHQLWYDHVRTGFGPDMMKGYAYLDYPRPPRTCPPCATGTGLRIGIIPQSDTDGVDGDGPMG